MSRCRNGKETVPFGELLPAERPECYAPGPRAEALLPPGQIIAHRIGHYRSLHDGRTNRNRTLNPEDHAYYTFSRHGCHPPNWFFFVISLPGAAGYIGPMGQCLFNATR